MKRSARTNTNLMKMGSRHESVYRLSPTPASYRQSGHFRTPRHHHLDRIMRLILIDNYSGYIFGEFRCSDYAARATDGQDPEIIGAVERDCEFLGFVESKK